MKKWLSMILALLMALTLFGCSQEEVDLAGAIVEAVVEEVLTEEESAAVEEATPEEAQPEAPEEAPAEAPAEEETADEEEAESRLGSGLYGLFGRVIVLGGEIGQVRRIIGGEADGYGSAAGCGVRDDGGERVGRQTDGGCAGKTGAGAPGDRFRREAAGN